MTGEYVTLWEAFATQRLTPSADFFIKGPSGRQRMPVLIFPEEAFDPKIRQDAANAFETCLTNAGAYGQRTEGVANPNYIEASERFYRITGVNFKDITSLARNMLYQSEP